MRQMWKKRGHSNIDSTGKIETEEGGISGARGRDRREDYIITLLEIISYQLYRGPLEFDAYLEKVVKKNADKLS